MVAYHELSPIFSPPPTLPCPGVGPPPGISFYFHLVPGLGVMGYVYFHIDMNYDISIMFNIRTKQKSVLKQFDLLSSVALRDAEGSRVFFADHY